MNCQICNHPILNGSTCSYCGYDNPQAQADQTTVDVDVEAQSKQPKPDTTASSTTSSKDTTKPATGTTADPDA